MLVLSCKKGQTIVLKSGVEITVLSIRKKLVQLEVSNFSELNIDWKRTAQEKKKRKLTRDYILSLFSGVVFKNKEQEK